MRAAGVPHELNERLLQSTQYAVASLRAVHRKNIFFASRETAEAVPACCMMVGIADSLSGVRHTASWAVKPTTTAQTLLQEPGKLAMLKSEVWAGRCAS